MCHDPKDEVADMLRADWPISSGLRNISGSEEESRVAGRYNSKPWCIYSTKRDFDCDYGAGIVNKLQRWKMKYWYDGENEQ